ncbi:hypothetical protein C7C46_10050 [Streptomyces tateyamensis]|uniref:Uncharacterized protein n=1 Tax=Streptomyces tateyamensis TaxID=565073 RepID=A0A2V4NRV3_9ACTN|nr:hypothetical protein [Streptomyces tateyamensis]PYC82688.1 hypothetical protein C7C46_10050 [Streptomyces tateyamensis]
MRLRTSSIVGITATALSVAAIGYTVLPVVGELLGGPGRPQAGYVSGAQAKAARPSLPHWLPDSATEVDYKASSDGGNRLLHARLTDGALPAACTTAVSSARPAKLTARWFPAGIDVRPTASCGQYLVVLDGEQLYAWQTDAARVPVAEAAAAR